MSNKERITFTTGSFNADRRRGPRRELRVVAQTPAADQPSGWRSVGLRDAAASSSRRTGVV